MNTKSSPFAPIREEESKGNVHINEGEKKKSKKCC